MKIIRKTTSTCPECLRKISADIIEDKDNVYMIKECLKHGMFKVLLAKDISSYNQLSNAYFSVNSSNGRFISSSKQEDFILMLTYRCNLNCSICYTDSNNIKYKDPSIDEIKKAISGLKKSRIFLFGGEPTVREDLPQIIKTIIKSQNFPALFTNGIKLQDLSYCKKLKECGLKEVRLSFDSFDDKDYNKIRGISLLKEKLKTLHNLERLKIPTTLEVTVLRGINDKSINSLLDYAVNHNFIKGIFFRHYTYLGRKGFNYEKSYTLFELVDLVANQTKNKISKKDIISFQKLIYIYYKLINKRKCFHDLIYFLYRKDKNYITLKHLFNLNKLDSKIDCLLKSKKLKKSDFYLSLMTSLNIKSLFLLKEILHLFLKSSFSKEFNASEIQSNLLFIGFQTLCNAYTIDLELTKNCTSGILLPGKIENRCEGHVLHNF